MPSIFDSMTSGQRGDLLRRMGVQWVGESAGGPEDQALAAQVTVNNPADTTRQVMVDAMIRAEKEKVRKQLLSMNPGLRGTAFDVDRAAPLPAYDVDAGQRAAQLRANPALADRISAERALTAQMAPAPGPALADTSDARANALLQSHGILKGNELATARQPLGGAVPFAPNEQWKENLAARQRKDEAARALATRIAQGKRGMISGRDYFNMVLARQPGAAQLAANSQDNLTRFMVAKMGMEAERAQKDAWRQHDASQRALDRTSHETIAGMRAPELSIDQKLQLQAIKDSGETPDRKLELMRNVFRQGSGPSPASVPNSAPASPPSTAPAQSLLPNFGENPTVDSIVNSLGSMPDGRVTPDMLLRIRQNFPLLMTDDALAKMQGTLTPSPGAIFMSRFGGKMMSDADIRRYELIQQLRRATGTK